MERNLGVPQDSQSKLSETQIRKGGTVDMPWNWHFITLKAGFLGSWIPKFLPIPISDSFSCHHFLWVRNWAFSRLPFGGPPVPSHNKRLKCGLPWNCLFFLPHPVCLCSEAEPSFLSDELPGGPNASPYSLHFLFPQFHDSVQWCQFISQNTLRCSESQFFSALR